MKRGIIRLVVLVFLIHVTHTLDPCQSCARNAHCPNKKCVCETGGDPYFNCQNNDSYYCTLRKTNVFTFNNESAKIRQSCPTPLALLTTRRNARFNGVCEFNLSVGVGGGLNMALEVEFFLKQRDIIGIAANVSMKIKSLYLNGYFKSEIFYRPIGEVNYTLSTILKSTDNPLGSGQFASFGCPVTYEMMTDDVTVVNIPCCGLELGLRPDTTKAHKTMSGVYLKVTRASVIQPQPNITVTIGGSGEDPPCVIKTI